MSVNSTTSYVPGDTIDDSTYCNLELEDNTYGWERDTSTGETQWVYKPQEVQQNSEDDGGSYSEDTNYAGNGGAEDNSVAPEIGTQAAADVTKAVETSALTDEEKTQLENLRNELTNINAEIEKNNNDLNNLEYQITVLQGAIEENVAEAINKSEEITQDQKEEAKDIVQRNINEYTAANGEMTYEEFMNNLSGDLNNVSRTANFKLTSAVRRIIEAENRFSSLDALLGNLNNTITKNKELATQAEGKQAEIKNLVTKVTEKNSDVDKDINTEVEEVTQATDFEAKQNELQGKSSELHALEDTAIQNLGMDKQGISNVTAKLNKEAEEKGENIENIFAQWKQEEAQEENK